MSRPTPPPPGPLLSVRTAVVMLAALVAGVLAGALSYFATSNLPGAALVGCGAVIIVLQLMHRTLGQETTRDE